MSENTEDLELRDKRHYHTIIIYYNLVDQIANRSLPCDEFTSRSTYETTWHDVTFSRKSAVNAGDK